MAIFDQPLPLSTCRVLCAGDYACRHVCVCVSVCVVEAM